MQMTMMMMSCTSANPTLSLQFFPIPPPSSAARCSHGYWKAPLCHVRCSRRRRKGRSFSLSHGVCGATMSAVELKPSLELKNKAVEMANALKGTTLFLVGMNSTMKTDLGKALADALRYYYFDSDSLVEQAAGGKSAAEVLRENDEEGFFNSETEVLKQLSSMGRLVVCAGDGAVQSSTNLGYLRYGISIWIDVPLDILADEVLKSGLSTSNSFDEVKLLLPDISVFTVAYHVDGHGHIAVNCAHKFRLLHSVPMLFDSL